MKGIFSFYPTFPERRPSRYRKASKIKPAAALTTAAENSETGKDKKKINKKPANMQAAIFPKTAELEKNEI